LSGSIITREFLLSMLSSLFDTLVGVSFPLSLNDNLSLTWFWSSDPFELNSLYFESSSSFNAAASYSSFNLSFSSVDNSFMAVFLVFWSSNGSDYSKFRLSKSEWT